MEDTNEVLVPSRVRYSSNPSSILNLEKWMVWFGDCYELVPASALFSIFSPWALFYSATTPSGPFSMLCFDSLLAKVSSLDLVWSELPPKPSVEGLDL
jgi:hypothetical protein